MKNIITVTRYWHSPKIQTQITNEKIQLSMDIDDFKLALEEEMKSLHWMSFITNGKIVDKLNEAIDNIIEKVKEESIKVV